MTAPHPEAIAATRAVRLAMEEADYSPDDTVYINAHGTGTQLNDVSETKAIKGALGEAARRAMISSTKSMIAKLIVSARTRAEAIRKMQAALCEMVVEGVEHNAQTHIDLLSEPAFLDGSYTTDFLANRNA